MPDNRSIDILHFSPRVARRLAGAGIRTIGQLGRYSDVDLLALPGFGKTCLAEVHHHLALLEEQPSTSLRPFRQPSGRTHKAGERLASSSASSYRGLARDEERAQEILALHEQGLTPRQ